MSRTIHINLLKKSERRSSLPVRFRVMVPLLSCLMVLIILIGTGILSAKRKSLEAELADIAAKREDLKSSYVEYSALKAREHAGRVELGQLERYLRARHVYAPALLRLPHVVPSAMQLMSLHVTPPVRVLEPVAPQANKGAKKKTPMMSEREAVRLRLSGLVASANAIDTFKSDLLSGAFTNWIVDVEVPRGAFKAGGDGYFVFELNAEFTERVFQ